jgi:DNA repair protein RecN (Recombination protein N)
MPGTRFAIALSRRPDPAGLLVDGSRLAFDESGVDQAEFTFSANPGEPPRPLVRIASGGELARLMLALHSILMQAHNIPVLVFDELEQGVGGRLGRVIGTKLWKLARHHQVLCVTHLAQVAAFADAHFVVTKASDGGRTSTAVRRADGQERVEELALLLAGPPVAAPALRNAEDLLLRVNEWKDAQIGERTVASPSA